MPFLNHTDYAKVRAAMESGLMFFAGADSAQLSEALTLLDKAQNAVASPGLCELANEIHGTDECEIDDEGAGTSEADAGIWVQAWVWVPHEELVEHGLREPDDEADDPETVG